MERSVFRELLPLLEEAKGKCGFRCNCTFGGGDIRDFSSCMDDIVSIQSGGEPITLKDVELNQAVPFINHGTEDGGFQFFLDHYPLRNTFWL